MVEADVELSFPQKNKKERVKRFKENEKIDFHAHPCTYDDSLKPSTDLGHS